MNVNGSANSASNSFSVDVTLMLALGGTGVIAVAVNTCVVLSVVYNANLRTPLDKAITSLAVVDILSGLVGTPIVIVIYKNGNCSVPQRANVRPK